MNMVSSLPTSNPLQGRSLESQGGIPFTHNIFKEDSGAGLGYPGSGAEPLKL